MARSWIRVLVAFVVLVGVTLYVSNHRKKEFQKNEKEAQDLKVVTLDLETVGRVDVQSKEGNFSFRRREKDKDGKYLDRWAPLTDEVYAVSDWIMTRPVESLTDAYAVKGMLDNLKTLEATKVVDEKGERAAEYELDRPALTIELFEKDSAVPKLTLKLGAKNAAATGMYAQASTSPRVVLTGLGLGYIADWKTLDWRAKEILGFKNMTDVTEVSVRYAKVGDGESFVARQNNGEWTLGEPRTAPADKPGIERFLNDLKGLRAKEFVGSEDGKFGFDKPYATIVLKTKAGDKEETRTLVVGGKIEKGKDLYVRRGDAQEICAVEAATKDKLTKTFKDLITKKAFVVDQGAVDRVEIVEPSGSTTDLSKKSGTWSLTRPVADLADAQEAESLLSKVLNLSGLEYLGATLPKSWKTPTTAFRVWAGGKVFEAAVLEAGNEKEIGIRGSEPVRFYRAARGSIDGILGLLQNLRERQLASGAVDLIAGAKIRKGPLEIGLKRGDGGWTLGEVKGAQAPLLAKLREKPALDALTDALEKLSIDEFVQTKVDTLGVGDFTITYERETGSPVSWDVGKKEEEKRLVWSKERGVVGRVSAGPLDEIEGLWR